MGSLVTQSGGGRKPIEEGRYDARVIGLVGLGLQSQRPFKGQERPDVQKVKLIFELTNAKRELKDGTEVTEVCAKSIAASLHEKGNFCKYAAAIKNTTFSTDKFTAFVAEDANLKGLLGTAVQIDIAHFEAEGKTLSYVAGAIGLDARIECPEATRNTFMFFPNSPDLDAWKEMTFYTKKEIMDAKDASTFPKELHAQWVADQEAESVKQAEYEAGKDKKDSGDNGVIQ